MIRKFKMFLKIKIDNACQKVTSDFKMGISKWVGGLYRWSTAEFQCRETL